MYICLLWIFRFDTEHSHIYSMEDSILFFHNTTSMRRGIAEKEPTCQPGINLQPAENAL
jgi:hypothetical protein